MGTIYTQLSLQERRRIEDWWLVQASHLGGVRTARTYWFYLRNLCEGEHDPAQGMGPAGGAAGHGCPIRFASNSR